jgi:hypothetical protein
MKSSLHSLIPLLPLLLYQLLQPSLSVQFLCTQAHILAGWHFETQLTQLLLWTASTYFTSVQSTDLNWTRSVESYDLIAYPQATPRLLLYDVTAYVLTQSLHSNGCTRHITYRDNSSIVACEHYLATAVSLATQFLH